MILPKLCWVRFSRPFNDGLNFHMHDISHLLWPVLIVRLLETLEVSLRNVLNCTELEHLYISCISVLQVQNNAVNITLLRVAVKTGTLKYTE